MNKQNYRIYTILFSVLLASILSLVFIMSSSTSVDSAKAVKIKQSPYPFEQTVRNIKQAIVNNNFKVIRESESENAHTIYFCNFSVAHESIKTDQRSGILLPCKIRVIQDKEKVFIATLNIESVRKQLGIQVTTSCKQIKRSIDQIIEDSVI